MFDLGWSELLVIAAVAIIVVGPKDLPKLMRTVGQWIRRARTLASEFQSGMMDLADADDLKDLKDMKKDIEEVTNFDMAGPDFSKNTKTKAVEPAKLSEAGKANGKKKPQSKAAKKAKKAKKSAENEKKSVPKPKAARKLTEPKPKTKTANTTPDKPAAKNAETAS